MNVFTKLEGIRWSWN